MKKGRRQNSSSLVPWGSNKIFSMKEKKKMKFTRKEEIDPSTHLPRNEEKKYKQHVRSSRVFFFRRSKAEKAKRLPDAMVTNAHIFFIWLILTLWNASKTKIISVISDPRKWCWIGSKWTHHWIGCMDLFFVAYTFQKFIKLLTNDEGEKQRSTFLLCALNGEYDERKREEEVI